MFKKILLTGLILSTSNTFANRIILSAKQVAQKIIQIANTANSHTVQLRILAYE